MISEAYHLGVVFGGSLFGGPFFSSSPVWGPLKLWFLLLGVLSQFGAWVPQVQKGRTRFTLPLVAEVLFLPAPPCL